jgi:hypothetical protein
MTAMVDVRPDGLLHFVERSDFDDSTIDQFEAELLAAIDGLDDDGIFLLADLSEVNRLPTIIQARRLRDIIRRSGISQMAVFGVDGVIRVAVRFVAATSGLNSTVFATELEAAADLTRLGEAGR